VCRIPQPVIQAWSLGNEIEMKCPKCSYLGLDDLDRCRNCGYEFALSEAVDPPDLSIRSDTGPGEPLPTLPLFGRGLDDDAPLITRPSPPRVPLSVRRSTPDVPRMRTTPPRTATLDLDLDGSDDAQTAARLPMTSAIAHSIDPGRKPDSAASVGEDAGVSLRLLAVLVDSAILLTIDAAVIYFTMQICSVSSSELGLLPKVPLAAFLVVQNIGYLLAFTAGGQTLGKMAAGLRIVPAHSGDSLDMHCAVKRTVAWLVLAVPAGLGLLSACFSRDHRGLHDRFAGTRVIRASV
jgi:uncharacterized RDD family membrane protein YckC